MEAFNHALFLALNASSSPPTPLVLLALFAAKFLILLVPLHIALVWAGGTRAMRFLALTAVLALSVTLTVNGIIGAVVYTPRPFLIGLGQTLVEHRPSASFPSNHGTVFFTYAMTLGLFSVRRLALGVACTGLLVGWSRIYLDVHFPLDMLGAALVSAVGAVVSVCTMLRYGEPVTQMSERLHRLIFDGQLLRTALASSWNSVLRRISGGV